MKPVLKIASFILLIAVLVHLSCKKEYSCEGCAEKNKPPIANAGPDQVITLPTDSVLLDGKNSSDPDGRITQWLWKKISGPTSLNILRSSDSATVVKNLVTGTYLFELKVTDNGRLSATDTMKVIVDSVLTINHPPVANAGTDQTITLPTNTVNLDGSGSTDPDNNIAGYGWTKISGLSSFNIVNSNAAQTLVINLVQSIYQFELTVTDAGGLVSKDTVQVIVDSVAANHPPIANAGADQTIILPNNTVSLDGSGSTDPDNNITNYAWAKISGTSSFNISNANAVQTQVSNLVQGVYQFELKVTDAGGLFSKDTMQVTVLDLPCAQLPSIATVCDNTTRLQICAQLIPIGTVSQTRYGIAVASVGNKVLFAGGNLPDGLYGAGSTRVDIYDWVTNTWSKSELSQGRGGMATAVLGNKIFFGGGYKDNNRTSSKVDIYDGVTNTWTTDELSLDRTEMAAASAGNKVVFAGGVHAEDGFWDGGTTFTKRVDIYDALSNTWSVAALTETYLAGMSATTIGSKIYFAGGTGYWSVFDYNSTSKIDIYDAASNSWSQSSLSEPRGFHAAIAVNNKIYWAGGDTLYGFNTNSVEIRDANTQTSTFACLFQQNGSFHAVLQNNKIVFFTGRGAVNNKFDIYDLTTNTWSIGVLSQNIEGASIISVNNIIYVAGGSVNGVLSNQVYKLEF